MSQKVKNFLVLFTLFIVLSGFGLVSGNLIGMEMAFRQIEGYNSSWILLDSPLKFEKIVDATSNNVWAQLDGKLYYFSPTCYDQASCNQWVETQSVPNDIHSGLEAQLDEGITCPSAENFAYYKNPPGSLVKCVRANYYGMDIVPGRIVYYALTNNGKIWTWYYSNSMLVDEIIYTVFYSGFGFLLGITAFIIFLIKKRSKKTSKNETDAHAQQSAG